jgi:hypothetical protein
MINEFKYILDATNVTNRQPEKFSSKPLLSVINFIHENLDQCSIERVNLSDGHLCYYRISYKTLNTEIELILGEYEPHQIRYTSEVISWTQEISLIKSYNFKIVEILDMLKNHITRNKLWVDVTSHNLA